jgi:chromosome partitioning protein
VLLCLFYQDLIYQCKVEFKERTMGLMNTLDQCITAGHEMTKAIAIAQFNDDSPEARKITRRWRVGEAADLIGVSSQAIRDAEKAGRLPHPDMEMRGRVEQRVGYTIEQINHMRDVFGTRLRRMTAFRPSSRWQHIKGCL